MTFQPGAPNTFVGTLPDQRSDYEEQQSKIPTGRSQMQTGIIVAAHNPAVIGQQGTVKTQNDKPTIAGIDPAAIAFYRWW